MSNIPDIIPLIKALRSFVCIDAGTENGVSGTEYLDIRKQIEHLT